MNEYCESGCRKKEHMFKCHRCGAEYHKGLVHHCPTMYWSDIC